MEQNGDAADDAQQKTTGHGEDGIIRRDNSVVALYDSSMIFSAKKESQDMIGTNNFDLAEAFYLARSSHPTEADNYVRNAGAVQLFDKDGINPVKIGPNKGTYYAMSESIDSAAKYSALGHSERILMKQVLDDFIIANGHEVEIPLPSTRPRFDDGRIATELDMYSQLAREAREYKVYLIARDTIVKMWSELKACEWKEREGGACKNFIDDIFPQQSQYGYIAEISTGTKMKAYLKESPKKNTKYIEDYKKKAFGVFKEAYDYYKEEELAYELGTMVLGTSPAEEDIKKAEEKDYNRSDIIQLYKENPLHLKFMTRDYDDYNELFLENSHDAEFIQFALEHYSDHIYIDRIQQELRGDGEDEPTAFIEFNAILSRIDYSDVEEYMLAGDID